MIHLVPPYYQLATGTVTRWHTFRTEREQSIAEHSARVTMIAVSLGHALGPSRFLAQDELEVRRLSEWHDIHEVEFGDMPHPVKSWLLEFESLDFDRAADAAFAARLGLASPMLEARHLSLALVAVADRLEGACFYWQEGRTQWHPDLGHVPTAIVRTALKVTLRMMPELVDTALGYLEQATVPADLLMTLRGEIERELAA